MNNNANVTVKIGKAKMIIRQVVKTDHENKGIRISFMPGARILRMVTRKLIPVVKLPIPEIKIPQI